MGSKGSTGGRRSGNGFSLKARHQFPNPRSPFLKNLPTLNLSPFFIPPGVVPFRFDQDPLVRGTDRGKVMRKTNETLVVWGMILRDLRHRRTCPSNLFRSTRV